MDNSKPTWIIFDLGEVLYKFDEAMEEAAKFLNVSRDDLYKAYFTNNSKFEVSKKDYIEILQEMLNRLDKNVEPQVIADIIFNKDKFSEDTLLLLKQLHNVGYKLALLTNTWNGVVKKLVVPLEEYKLFNKVFESPKLGLRKPDPQLFKYIERNIKSHGEEILFIDDREENIKAAKKMHWETFLYKLGKDQGNISNTLLREKLLV